MQFAALLRSRGRMLANSFRLATGRQRWTWVAMIGGWSVIAVWLVWALVGELDRATPGPMREHALAGLFFYLGILMILSAAPLTYGAMLQSQDLFWLMATPTTPASIAWLKIIDGLLGSARVFLPFCIPAYAASAWTMGITPIGWLWALVLWVGYCLFVAVLVQLLLLIAVQLLPVSRLPSAIVAINLVVSAMLTVFIARNPQASVGAIPLQRMPVPHLYLPQWCAGAFGAWARGDTVTVIADTLIVYALLGLVAYGAAVLGTRVFADAHFAEAAMASPRLTARRKLGHIRPPSIAAGIARKDLACYLRDPQIMSQAMAPLLIALLPFVLSARVAAEQDLMKYVAVAMISMTLYVQSSVLSLSAVGLEGRAFWLVKTAPVTAMAFLLAKWWFCCRFVMTVTTAITVVMWLFLRLPHALVAEAWVLSLGATLTLCGLGVGLSALFPRFAYDNPAQRVGVWSLLWGFALYITYIVVVGVVVYVTYALLAQMDAPPVAWIWAASSSVILLISLLFGLVPMVLGARRLAAYEWSH